MDRILSLVPVTENPFNAESPFDALASECTATEHFFVRNHFDVPAIATGEWSLRVAGAVANPKVLRLDALRALGSETLDVTMECAGNGRAFLDPQPAGTPWGLGAVSRARFTGTPLRGLLGGAMPSASAREVLFVGADAGPTKAGEVEPFARSLPLAVARESGAILAWDMNGLPLTRDHGSPLRLVVPGWYGMASVKWLQEIRVLEEPFRGFFQVDDYVFRERAGTPDGTPVTRMAPRALILSPRAGAVLTGRPEIRGIAWSGGGGVVRVEVSADGGRSWRDADLDPAASPHAARGFRMTLASVPGALVLVARATDAAGVVQKERSEWNRLGYVNNDWHRVEVRLQ